jgi:hypothetical protein
LQRGLLFIFKLRFANALSFKLWCRRVKGTVPLSTDVRPSLLSKSEAEEAHRQPRGKRATGAEINRHSLHPKATMFTKTALFNLSPPCNYS